MTTTLTKSVQFVFALGLLFGHFAWADSTVYQDDFNRFDLGPDWETCGNVSIVENTLLLSHRQNGGPPDCVHESTAMLVAPGAVFRDAVVQFDMDNGGSSRENNNFKLFLGDFWVSITQDLPVEPNPHLRRSVTLVGPSGQLAQVVEILIDPGRYEFSVSGTTVRFRNISGGTMIDVQGMDLTATGPGPLKMSVNEEVATRIDNLVIRRATLRVEVDVKPGSFPNSINLGSQGTVPVAIFSSSDFDATTIDPTTVRLASAPVRLRGKGVPQSSFEDVDGDGLLDLVAHVETDALALSDADTVAVVEAQTFDGLAIEGVDTVRIVP